MGGAWALVSILLQSLSAPIATAALLAVSLPAANETVNQHTSIFALPSDQVPNPSLAPSSIPSNNIALQLLDADDTPSLSENLTASDHFHIPDTTIDLTFTYFGRPLALRTVFETVGLAVDKISTNVRLHPTESITNGFFHQGHEGLAIRVHQYVGDEITWFLLNWLLSGIQYYISQSGNSCEMRFEIDVVEKGRVGYGSLWDTGVESHDVAKRDPNNTSQQLRTSSVSKPMSTKSNHSLLLLIPKESSITFSYHFFGQTIPESELSTCFTLARQSIRAKVQLYPHIGIPNGLFQYRADDSVVYIGIKAYADKIITWLLLDDILQVISSDLIGENHLWACEFEFEIYPYEEPHGHGSLLYDEAALLLADPSQIAASAFKRTSPQRGYVNHTSNDQPSDTLSPPNPTPTWVAVVLVPGTPIRLLINSLGIPLPLWDTASTLSGARNEVLNTQGTHMNLPIKDGRFRYNHAGSSVWVRVVAQIGDQISWQDLNDVLKGLFDFLCNGKEARSRSVLFEVHGDGRGIVGGGFVYGSGPSEDVIDAL